MSRVTPDEADDRAIVVADRGDAQVGLEQLAVDLLVEHRALPQAAGADRLPHLAVKLRLMLTALEQSRVLPQRLLARIAGDLLEGRVDVLDGAVDSGDADRFADRLDRRRQPVALAFGALALGQVKTYPDQPVGLAVGAQHRRLDEQHATRLAAQLQRHLLTARRLLLEGLALLVRQQGSALGRKQLEIGLGQHPLRRHRQRLAVEPVDRAVAETLVLEEDKRRQVVEQRIDLADLVRVGRGQPQMRAAVHLESLVVGAGEILLGLEHMLERDVQASVRGVAKSRRGRRP